MSADAGKRESYEVLHDAVSSVGAKAVAHALKVSQALVYKWCQRPRDDESGDGELGSGARNPLDRVLGVFRTTDDRNVVDWLCERAGGFFTENPDLIEPANSVAFLAETQTMIQSFSGLLGLLTESMNNDGRIDTAEAKRIRTSWSALKAQLESLVVACERGLFDTFDDATGKRNPPRPSS